MLRNSSGCSINTSQGPSHPFRPVPKPGRKIAAGLKSDEILPLLLGEEVLEVTESVLSVQAGSVIYKGSILVKSVRTFSFGMINGQVLQKKRKSHTLKACPLSIQANRAGAQRCVLQVWFENRDETTHWGTCGGQGRGSTRSIVSPFIFLSPHTY